jgi:hypothetical protein
MRSALSCVYGFITSLILLNISCVSPDPSVLELKENWKIQSSATIKSAGEQISSNEFHPDSWYPVAVPTTVLAALVENKVIPIPFMEKI